jgi:hypothetical protein
MIEVLVLGVVLLLNTLAPLAAQQHLDPEAFAAWGEEHDYAAGHSKDGRVLLIADTKRLKKHMKLVEKVLNALDGSALGGGAPAAGPDAPTMILLGLRDPEEFDQLRSIVMAAGGAKDGEDGAAAEDGAAGQDGEAGEDADAADVHDQPFFRSLDFDTTLTVLDMQLDAAQLAGFWDEGFEWQGQAKDPDMKPSNHPDSQIANRLAHLWIYRQYGPQPAWLRRGLAWRFEYETAKVDRKKGIGRFPQMLFSAIRPPEQPRTWNSALEGPLRDLDEKHFEGLVEWGAAYHAPFAARAWGLTSYLLNDKKHSKALPTAMRDLASAGTAHFEESEEDFETPADEQLAILQAHFGDDVLTRATKAFKSAEMKFR